MKPARLKEGDLIALITPASTPSNEERIEKGKQYLIDKGFRVETTPNCCAVRGNLAGSDDERIWDIHWAFNNSEVKAIMALRGGYGAGRLLPGIDYSVIRNNPKIFSGFSDITTLQMAYLAKTGLVSFAGPMVAVDFGGTVSDYTAKGFFDIVSKGWKGEVPLPDGLSLEGNGKGSAKGVIVGGNLAVFCGMMGSSYLPDPEGKIFFFEDVTEPPYRIDRFLNNLRLAEYFEKAAGFIFGQFTEGETDDSPTLTQEEVFSDYLSMINKPVITNFPFGHVDDLFTIPFGIEVDINSNNPSVVYLESGVI